MTTTATSTPSARYNLDTCAVLVEFNASVWTARKLDRTASDEVVANKNAGAKDAARVNKNLFAGRTELVDIQHVFGKARTYVYEQTIPWSDSGQRLLPYVMLKKFNARMDEFDAEVAALVESFINIYPSLITAQAMALGDMFRRDDYPSPAELPHKFSFRVNYIPVPTSGDFRVDVGNAAQKELQEKMDKLMQERVDFAMLDVRERLSAYLKRMSDRLTSDEIAGESKHRKFNDSMIDGAIELCDLVKTLNVVGDVDLESARRELAQLLVGVTPTELRKNEAIREDTKKAVDAILDKFNF
jgi:hypothetical protein